MPTTSGERNVIASAAAAHDQLVAAYQAQRARFAPAGDMWSGCAGSFKADLQAPLDTFRSRIAEFIRPEDVLLDVGGGAGRLSLPLANRCGEVVCIDPSQAMGDVFEATVRDAGITNARFVAADWLDAEGIEGDVSLVAHVTYFVPAIAPFVDKLNGASRRRVVVATRSLPPPNAIAPFFKLLHGEDLEPVPGPEAVMAVLKELGITAEQIDAGEALAPTTAPFGKTPDEATTIQVEGGIRLGWVARHEADRYRAVIEQHFDDLFVETATGFRPRVALDARELIITWETR